MELLQMNTYVLAFLCFMPYIAVMWINTYCAKNWFMPEVWKVASRYASFIPVVIACSSAFVNNVGGMIFAYALTAVYAVVIIKICSSGTAEREAILDADDTQPATAKECLVRIESIISMRDDSYKKYYGIIEDFQRNVFKHKRYPTIDIHTYNDLISAYGRMSKSILETTTLLYKNVEALSQFPSSFLSEEERSTIYKLIDDADKYKGKIYEQHAQSVQLKERIQEYNDSLMDIASAINETINLAMNKDDSSSGKKRALGPNVYAESIDAINEFLNVMWHTPKMYTKMNEFYKNVLGLGTNQPIGDIDSKVIQGDDCINELI